MVPEKGVRYREVSAIKHVRYKKGSTVVCFMRFVYRRFLPTQCGPLELLHGLAERFQRIS